jgi:hypothetical protein
MQKLTKKLSLVMVALMTVFTALSYMPAKAATVVPKVQFVGEQKTEFNAGERITFNLNAANYGGRVQYRVVLWNDAKKSYSDLWNTADRYYTNWMPYGNETLPLGWVINEPGTYRITIYAKRANLANSKTALKGMNCDSFLNGPAFVVKPAAATPDSIAPVADVTVTEGEKPVLPETVTLNLADKTTKTAKVTWETVDTTKVGTIAVQGTVEGTDKKATVNVIVVAKPVMDSVSAISNTQVEVYFDGDVSATTASNEDMYKIVEKGTTTALEVKGVTVEATDKVVLETAAQKAGQSYTITVAGKSLNFAGVAAVAGAPAVTKIESVDTNTVEVTFDKKLDKVSAETIANYTINNGATIKSAALSDDRDVVTLTTENVGNNKLYTLKVENVKSIDGVVMKSASSRNFIGKIDNLAAKLSSITVLNNTRIRLYFADDHGVSKESATNLANYEIKTGTEVLEISSITAKDFDFDGYYEAVEIITAPQASNKLYTLTVNNLVDGSSSANVIAKALTKTFRGILADKSAPTVDPVIARLTNTTIEVKFYDKNALDTASATDLANYELNNDLTVEKVEVKSGAKPYDNGYTTVIITTSEQTVNKNYALTIKGVKDEFGNEIKPVSGTTYRKYYFLGKGIDLVPPFVKSVVSVDDQTVKVVFDDRVDEVSAEDPTNYVFNNDLGSALTATLQKDGVTVKLTTPSQTANKTYKITMNGVNDLSGNVLASVTASFVSTTTTLDTTNPEVLYAEALYNNEIRVYFSEPVQNATTMNIQAGAEAVIIADYVGAIDETTLVYEPQATLVNGKIYAIKAIAGVTDMSNNAYVLPAVENTFVGTQTANYGPTITSWEQIDAKTVRVYFDEPVALTGTAFPTTVGGVVTPVIDPNGDGDYEGSCTLDLRFASALVSTNPINWNFTLYVTDLVGTGAVDENDTALVSTGKTEMVPYVGDEEKPYITGVIATSNHKIKVMFSEDVVNAGSYKISYVDDNGITRYLTVTGVSIPNSAYPGYRTSASITVSDTLTSERVYTLVPLVGATDVVGLRADVRDVEFDFVGSDVSSNADYVKGVEIVDAKTLTVALSSGVAITTAEVFTFDADGNMGTTSTVVTTNAAGNVVLSVPVLLDVKYQIYVNGSLTYDFYGVTPDGGIRVQQVAGGAATAKEVTFSGLDITTYDVTVNGTPATEVPGQFQTTATTGDTALVVVTRTTDNMIIYAAEVVVE